MAEARNESARILAELFDAERRVRSLHRQLGDMGPALVADLRAAVEEARGVHDEDERTLRLVRIAALCGEWEGGDVVDLLIDLLGSEEPEARHTAGEALQELAFERFKEVALGVERALERLPVGDAALGELPYLLAEVGEPSAVKLVGKFLQHRDADAVAAAIESLMELGDPAAVPWLGKLVGDPREVVLEGDDDGERITLGELAEEAQDLLARKPR
jgi:HEAT repeat protein